VGDRPIRHVLRLRSAEADLDFLFGRYRVVVRKPVRSSDRGYLVQTGQHGGGSGVLNRRSLRVFDYSVRNERAEVLRRFVRFGGQRARDGRRKPHGRFELSWSACPRRRTALFLSALVYASIK